MITSEEKQTSRDISVLVVISSQFNLEYDTSQNMAA